MPSSERKTLLLNLPNRQIVTRRYMCSYNSPMSLFPPYELISLGGILRHRLRQPVELIDAIAERLDRCATMERIAASRPALIVTLSGFECFGEDMEEIAAIKRAFPTVPIVLCGHYPTVFPEDVLANASVDYVVLGEPDLGFEQLFRALTGDLSLESVDGIAYRCGDRTVIRPGGRIPRIEALPTPAFELLPSGKYNEPGMPGPLGMVQSTRGCPFGCNYCVRSYGRRLTAKSVPQVIEEIRLQIREQRIRSLRFIDDTFTIDRQRVTEICRAMIEERLRLPWACLTRTDCLDRELLEQMKLAGCRRIYFGIESGSQRILDLYRKGVKREEALATLRECREVGIETSAFFLVGSSFETDEDFAETIRFAREAQLSYAMIAPLTFYPGTDLFDQFREELDFSLFPYRNELKSSALNHRWERWEKEFYRRFYFSPGYVARNLRALARSPGAMLRFAGDAFRFSVLGTRESSPFANLRSSSTRRTESQLPTRQAGNGR